MTKPGLIAGLSLAVAVLVGCAPAHQDLRNWMAQQRQNARPQVTPIKEPTPFVPAVYDDGGLAEAFALQRLTSVLRGDDAEADTSGDTSLALINPELNRRKEPLEDFPLDAMSMVGLLENTTKKVALVRVNGLLYQVVEGSQNEVVAQGEIQRAVEGRLVVLVIAEDEGAIDEDVVARQPG